MMPCLREGGPRAQATGHPGRGRAAGLELRDAGRRVKHVDIQTACGAIPAVKKIEP